MSGDKAAWDAFVRQYSNLVYHTIYKTLTLHHREARDDTVEDLYQEFFISIIQNGCRKLSQFRADRGCSVASWLRVIASRLTVDYLRRQHPVNVQVDDTVPSEQPHADTLSSLRNKRADCPKP